MGMKKFRADMETDFWFKHKTTKEEKRRPAWAGTVKIMFKHLSAPRRGVVSLPYQVRGIIVPASTAGRPSAPEPLSGVRVSQSETSEARYRYDPLTGLNYNNTGMPDVQKGHIMALELGGPDLAENIVPQWANWQANGRWRQNEIALCARAQEVMKTKGRFLLFHALVRYPKSGSFIRMAFPSGFKVAVTEVDKDGNPQGPPTVVINEQQVQDDTDDKMVLRMEEDMGWPDVQFKTRTRRGKTETVPEFGQGGQDPMYRPDLRPYQPPGLFLRFGSSPDLNDEYMQKYGNKIALDMDLSMYDDDSEYEYKSGDEASSDEEDDQSDSGMEL
jgi:hypothetical protein